MEKGPIQNIKNLAESISGPTNLRHGKIDEEKTKKVCREFESLLWQQIFKLMRSLTWGGAKGSSNWAGNEIYQTLIEQEMSRTLAHKKGIGIGDFLYKQIIKQQEKMPPKAIILGE